MQIYVFLTASDYTAEATSEISGRHLHLPITAQSQNQKALYLIW